MIDFYYWPTPNGWKISIMLEETGLPYRLVPVNIGKGDQFKPEFLAISPNNRMPAIVDHDSDGETVSVFESGAILLHLAEKSGRFIPQSRHGRKETMEWLFWQVGRARRSWQPSSGGWPCRIRICPCGGWCRGPASRALSSGGARRSAPGASRPPSSWSSTRA